MALQGHGMEGDMEIEAHPLIERVEGRLERLGLNAEEALRAAGLPPDLLENIRQGKARVPRGQSLVRLSEALSTSVAYLVGLDPDAQPPQELLEEDQANLGLLAADEDALLRAYRRLDIPARAAALHVMLTMAGPEPQPTGRHGKRAKLA
ncbi:hypothetical protein [Teichococcus aestuarii]